MNLSLSVLRHLIKGKARCNNTNRCTQWYDDLCAERHVVLGVFESRQNVKCNFDIFKIFFSRSRLPPLEILSIRSTVDLSSFWGNWFFAFRPQDDMGSPLSCVVVYSFRLVSACTCVSVICFFRSPHEERRMQQSESPCSQPCSLYQCRTPLPFTNTHTHCSVTPLFLSRGGDGGDHVAGRPARKPAC